jgi:protein-S-isoprenylcysteine O-methyltransferase Ste14
MRISIAASALKIVANAVVVLAFLLQAYVCFRRFRDSGSLNWLGLVAVNSVMVTMYVARSDASAISRSVHLWLLAIGGTLMPLAVRPTAASGFVVIGTAVQIVGTAGIIAALLSLRRSFGIVPAHRGIRTGGLYRVVRHPLYAAELLTILGIVLAGPSPLNASAFACFCALQVLRARAEERFLGGDPIYSAYRDRVKYRLIPGVI